MKFYKAIAVLMAAAALFTGCSSNSATVSDAEYSDLGNSNGNINNLGSICADDTSLYYQKADDNYKLYKSDLDGDNETALNSCVTYFINCYGDKIYYANGDDEFSIYVMNKDGSDNKKIITAPAYYVTLYNDKIYYVDFDQDYKLYSADLNGENITEVTSDRVFYPAIYADKLFYVNLTDGAKIYTADPDGSDKKLLVDAYCGYLTMYNDCIFYTMPSNEQTETGDDALYRYSLLDGTSEKMIDAKCADINIYNNRIYYRDMEKKTICSSDLDGDDIRTEVAEEGTYINITNDIMFYIVKGEDGNTELKSKEL